MDEQTISGNWKSEVQHRRNALLNSILLAGAAIGLLAIIYLFIGGKDLPTLLPFFIGWAIVLTAWALHRLLSYRIRAWVLILVAYAMGGYLLYNAGLPGSGRIWLLMVPTLAVVLLDLWPNGVIAGVLSVLTYGLLALLVDSQTITPTPQDLYSLRYWTDEGFDLLLAVTSLTLIMWAFNRGWSGALAEASVANEQLQARTKELENTTKQLHRQAFQLQATAEIAHAGSSILDPVTLREEVVNRIQAGLGPMDVYYVGLFLLDDVHRQAVLKAATGSVGRQMVEEGYRLDIDETSAVGYCLIDQQPHIVDRIEQFDNPLLESTRSEIALPLRSRGRTLGALSVQSTQELAFEEADITILQTMADQVAVAIDNAQLFVQTGTALREVQAAHQRYLGRAWREFLNIRPVTRIDYTQPGMEAGDGQLLRDARHAAMVHKRTVATDSPLPESEEETFSPQTVLAIPLKLREQVIGTIALHETRRQRPWTSEEIDLAETVAEQVAQTVENLRLMNETQRRAAHERLTSEVTAQVRETLDMDTILQTAAQEIREKLELRDVTIRLQTPKAQT